MPAKKKYTVGYHVWIKGEKGHFLGKGRVELLENIQSTGSITKGAAAMKMSYRQAWQMVEDMNKTSVKPLVEKILGGKGGGGAAITEAGEKAIKLFYEVDEKMKKYAAELSKTVKF